MTHREGFGHTVMLSPLPNFPLSARFPPGRCVFPGLARRGCLCYAAAAYCISKRRRMLSSSSSWPMSIQLLSLMG